MAAKISTAKVKMLSGGKKIFSLTLCCFYCRRNIHLVFLTKPQKTFSNLSVSVNSCEDNLKYCMT